MSQFKTQSQKQTFSHKDSGVLTVFQFKMILEKWRWVVVRDYQNNPGPGRKQGTTTLFYLRNYATISQNLNLQYTT